MVATPIGNLKDISFRALETFQEADFIACEDTRHTLGLLTHYEISKPLISCRAVNEAAASEKIVKLLDEGKNVGFLTIGDTMTYSTYVYILEHLPEKYLVETVPGVSSFVDMASRFNFPLMIGDETLKVVSLNKKTNIEFELENNDNIVFMKVSRNFENLKQALIKTGNIDKIIMVSNCGKESQKVYYDIKDLTEDDIPYFTTLIVKKSGFEKWKKFNI